MHSTFCKYPLINLKYLYLYTSYRDTSHLENNPEYQWTLKQIAAEEAGYEREILDDLKKKEKAKKKERRGHIRAERAEKLTMLPASEQRRITKKLKERKDLIKEEERLMFLSAMSI